MENSYLAKLKRTFTSILPVDKSRKGKCASCGECCKLPNVCPFFRQNKEKSYCLVYFIRPLNCRKYPRTGDEHITKESCGFSFESA